jgi:glycosyltransferase involved in cell wall biosynthesis
VELAIVADQLSKRGGAERVFLVMATAFERPRLLTSFFDQADTFADLAALPIETSRLNRFAVLRKDPRRAFPLMRSVFEGFALDDVDAVLCSSAGWSHGVRTPAPRVVYCHNPPRWLFQTDSYLRSCPAWVRKAFLAAFDDLVEWDRERATSAARYLVNSTTVADRVRTAYGIEPVVLHPPVSFDVGGPREPLPGLPERFYLTVGRPRSYKNTDVVCEVFARRRDIPLVVVGGLPSSGRGGWPPNITGLTGISDGQLRWLYAHCEAVVTMAEEDFGLTPVEGYAFGKPTLAVRAGGFLDTVVPGQTGEYVEDFSADALDTALRDFDAGRYDPDLLRATAGTFSPSQFGAALRAVVAEAVSASTPTAATTFTSAAA